MKTSKLLEKVGELLSPRARRRKREVASLRKLLGKLVEKEGELEAKATEARGEKLEKLERKIALVRLQRAKATELLEELDGLRVPGESATPDS